MALALGKETNVLFIAEATEPRIGHLQKLGNGLVRDEAFVPENLIERGRDGRWNAQCHGAGGVDGHDASPMIGVLAL